MRETFTYLGDGAYAAFDGHSIKLRANGHDRANGATDEVALDASAFRRLQDWVAAGYPDYNTGEEWKNA